jgi:hypothetical protein
MIQVNAVRPKMTDTRCMSVSFHTAVLTGDEIFQAYPLVQATCPNVDLASWKDFARFFAERENCGVFALKDPVNCICGVVAYQLDCDLNVGLVLAVHLFTTADLMNSSRTVQALLEAAETRAAHLGCNGLQIRLSGNQIKLGSRLSALGLSSGAGLFWKTVASRPRVN